MKSLDTVESKCTFWFSCFISLFRQIKKKKKFCTTKHKGYAFDRLVGVSLDWLDPGKNLEKILITCVLSA